MKFRVDVAGLIPREQIKFAGLAEELGISNNGRPSIGPCPICGAPDQSCFEPTREGYENGAGQQEEQHDPGEDFSPADFTEPLG